MSDQLTSTYARQLLPDRPVDAHKGSFGKVMVVAGSVHFPGAAWLAAAGAARSGAGLVTLAAGQAVRSLAARLPEATLLPVAEGDWGAIGPGAIDELSKALEGYQALLVGPGMGQGEATGQFLQALLGLEQPKLRARVGFLGVSPDDDGPTGPRITLPATVLDADALNLLAALDDWPTRLPSGRFIFTPHPGEFRRLLRVDSLPSDLVAIAEESAARWGQVVLLKGATTVIAAPDGRSLVHDGANPALATAGTGDVLAGVIAGLLAQGLSLYDAAALGVFLHAAAAARVRADLGDAGTLASDLLPELPRAIRALRQTT